MPDSRLGQSGASPELPVRVLISRAEGGVPGLYDLLVLKDWEADETLRDLTAGQVSAVCSRHGFHLDQIKAVPRV